MPTSSDFATLVTALQALPLISGDLAGIGGQIKQQPGDFFVEELPAYLPTGEGEHLFLYVEKRDLSGEQLLEQIATAFDLSLRDIGSAGTKDRRAITRQWVSVPARCEGRLPSLECDQIKVLDASRHRNKLRTGHLKGNHFSILVRDVSAKAIQSANCVKQELMQQGLPNYFGSQRFGIAHNSLAVGLQMLGSTMVGTGSKKKPGRFLRRMALSAVQSALFNLVLAKRIREESTQRIFVGDVMQVVETGGLFVVDDEAEVQDRFNQREIVPTGPMFGPKMRSAEGLTAVAENAILEEFGLSPTEFERYKKLTSGTRRPLFVFLKDFEISEEESGIRFEFSLPPGSYATVLLGELMKVDVS